MFLATILLAACITARGEGGSAPSGSVVTGPELLNLHEPTLYHALRLTIPALSRNPASWGAEGPRVYLDGLLIGGIEELRSIHVAEVVDVTWLGGFEATTRLGTGHQSGALLVRTSGE